MEDIFPHCCLLFLRFFSILRPKENDASLNMSHRKRLILFRFFCLNSI